MKAKSIEDHSEVKKYLDKVCRHIPKADRKSEVREEILSHIEAELDGVEENFDERLKLALEKFGDPEVLGKSLYLAQRTWPETFVKYFTVSMLMGLVLLYLTTSYFSHHYQEVIKKANEVVATRIPRFELAQKEVSKLNLLKETNSVGSDAGQFLNSRIQWVGINQRSVITVPEVSDAKWNREWIVAEIPTDLKRTDLFWIRTLRNFDYWDLFKSGPNARLIGERYELINPYTFPIPDFSFLSRAARIHLRRALDHKDVTSALKDVRHLARLAYTTETLVGNMTAVNLLKVERVTYDEAVKRKISVQRNYKPISLETIAQIKTTLWVTAGFADHAAPEVMARVFLDSSSKWPVGSCAGLAETAQGFVLTSEFLRKKYPFEFDTKEQVAVIHQVFEASKSHCRLTFHRQLVERTKEYANVINGSESFSMSTNWWERLKSYRFSYGQYIPYVRQGIGMELMAIARPDFSQFYERE